MGRRALRRVRSLIDDVRREVLGTMSFAPRPFFHECCTNASCLDNFSHYYCYHFYSITSRIPPVLGRGSVARNVCRTWMACPDRPVLSVLFVLHRHIHPQVNVGNSPKVRLLHQVVQVPTGRQHLVKDRILCQRSRTHEVVRRHISSPQR